MFIWYVALNKIFYLKYNFIFIFCFLYQMPTMFLLPAIIPTEKYMSGFEL